jgi:lactate dehydrogenase-like 2-hydroxyacid dehydrogenase
LYYCLAIRVLIINFSPENMKIVFLDVKTLGDVPNLSLFEEFGQVAYYQTTAPDQVAERISGAEIVITNKVMLDQAAMEKASDLKLICVAATGINNIDLDYARQAGIQVKNVEGYSTHSVAQLTFALLLHLLHRIAYFDNYVKQGSYAQSDIFTHLGNSFREIQGKRYGIIGLGNIGRQVARIAEAFGAEVVYYSASGRNTGQPYPRLSLEELLSTSDVISIHSPLNEQTHHLIATRELQQLRKTAILINVGRGGIVREADLAQALDQDLLAGAAMDVFEQEPIRPDNPLLHIRHKHKLVLTPHTLLIDKVGQNIRSFIQSA